MSNGSHRWKAGSAVKQLEDSPLAAGWDTGYHTGNLRVFDFVKLADTIVVFHGFQKKTQ